MSVPRFESLRTERLVIRPMRPDDVDALWKRRNDPSTAEFQGWAVPYPRDEAQKVVDGAVGLDGCTPSDGWIQLAIDDVDTDSAIGDLAVGLSFAGRCAEIGWTIDAGERGRGLATEAAAALVAWLFETVGVTRVQATMHPDNLASVRVAERLGMVFEGHTRNSYWVGEVNSDDWILAMTPDEWRAWTDRALTAPADVALVEVTESNLAAVGRVTTHRSQQRFVAPMASSFAQALVPGTHTGVVVVPWYRAIEADDVVVGFVMTTEPTDDEPTPHLWRLLIDRMHQRRGIGQRALDLVIERSRSLGATALGVDWVEGPGSPAPLYLANGFVPTGEIEDGETVALLELR